MLRLKRALQDCRIPQAHLCRATGRSKTQISLVLGDELFPADKDKFLLDVEEFVQTQPRLLDWLQQRELPVPALFFSVPDEEHHDPHRPLRAGINPGNQHKSRTLDLEDHITNLVGRSVLSDGDDSQYHLTTLAKVNIMLLRSLKTVCDPDQWGRIESSAAALLMGGAL